MGYKSVCLNCRKAFNHGTDYVNIRESVCPECNQPMILMTHRFRPPEKTDSKKWEVVAFLINNGFNYQHIYDDEIIQTYVPYPENMREAKEFVEKYKNQAQKK